MGNTGSAGPTGPAGPSGPAGPNGFLYMLNIVNGQTLGPYYAAPNETQPMNETSNVAYNSNGTLNAVVVPEACTVTYLKVGTYNYYISGTDTSTFTVLKNGNATSMSCAAAITTGGGKATCSDTTHTFAVAAGDTLTIKIAQTSSTPYVMYSSALACQ
jgi:hypothetical protein